MVKLFSDNLPQITTNEELRQLCAAHPQLDQAYVCQAAGASRRRKRVWMEKLWREFEPYADGQFLSAFQRDFNSRSWELYLGGTLLRRGYDLKSVGDEGPDLDAGRNGARVFIEAVAPGPGEGPDGVPDVLGGGLHSVPEEEMILRVSTALSAKRMAYDRYIEKGVLKPGDSYVIAVNRSAVALMPDPFLPLVIKCCFGVGHLTLRIPVADTPQAKAKGESFWSGRMAIRKRNNSEVSMLFFEDPANAGVSAVMYSIDSVINSPTDRRTIGENIHIIHNPNARNPVPDGFFTFGEERKVSGDFLNIVRRGKKWAKSYRT